MKLKILSGVLGITCFFILANVAFAGFGISPPYVRNDSLIPGSEYQQRIFLVRGDPVNDLRADIVINVPGVDDWFEIDRGNNFILPRGETKIPINIKVKVPDDAEYGNYAGTIRIRTSSVSSDGQSGVSIALGAQIDVNISVVDKEIKEFRVRRIGISDLNEGRSVGWLFFPGKIEFSMLIENIGNADVRPSRVTFDIYDTSGTELLEQTQNTNKIIKVKPFETREVIADIPTRLPPGGYLARYTIYNDDEIVQEGEINVSVLAYGTVASAGYKFFGLSASEKASIVVPVLLFILIFMLIVAKLRSWRGKKRP